MIGIKFPHVCREQDAIESGLIKKVLLRKSDSDVIPADGDLVRGWPMAGFATGWFFQPAI